MSNEFEAAEPKQSLRADFELIDIWCLEGGVPGVNGARWRTNAAPHGPVDTMFDGCGKHVNGAADEIIVYPNWSVVDTPARFPLTGADFGTSQEYYYSWVYFPQGVILEDNNGNTGEFINAYVGGKDQKPVFQKSVANTSGANGVGLGEIGAYSAGLYLVAIELSDFSVYGGVNLRWSLDGGKSFAPIPASNIYSEPPTVSCIKVFVNSDKTMETLDGTEFIFDPETCSTCPIECPVIEDIKSAPDYEFQTIIGCDDIDGDPANYVNVTQETLIVDGVKTVLFFTGYGTDMQAEYTIGGTFVDCASGLPLEDPPIVVNCDDWEILTVYDAIGQNGVNVERWNINAITGEPVSTVPSDIFVGSPDYSGMPSHDNGPADGPIVVENDLLVLDNTNDQSQARGWTYLYTPEPIRLREYHPRAEAVDYFLGKCCGPVSKVATGVYPNNSATNIAFDVSLPAGIHFVGFQIFDFSAYSSVDYQYSKDNGVTWARVPAAWLYTAKPRVTACQMKVCPETGLIADIRTGVLNTTASLCEPVLCVADGAIQVEGLQFAPKTFYKVNLPAPGTVEQQWIDSAVNTSTASGVSYLASFSGTDAEGYPSHANGAPDSTISSAIATTTNISNTGDDQAKSDFYIFLDKPTEIREYNPTAESSGVWISSCGSEKMSQVLDAPYTNTQPNYIGLYQPGCYRVRLYHADISANGVTRLQSKNAAGAWVSIPAYPTKPTVTVINGWYADDGNKYNQDKSEVLDDTYLCDDPRCKPSTCCETKETAGATDSAIQDVSPFVKSFVNSNTLQTLGVAAGTKGRIVSIEDTGGGLVYWTIDGSTPSATNGFTTTGPYHASYDLKNVPLDLVRLIGSAGSSDYSVAYEIYN